jgi:hypothetical protein
VLSRTSNKTRSLTLVLASAGALVWLSWLWEPTSDSQHATAADMPSSSVQPAAASAKAPARAPVPVSAADLKPEGGGDLPVIHEISVDKQTVCRGEENFVNVRATGPDGSDAHLRVSLHGTSSVGTRIPFRLYADSAETGPKVLVEGRGGREVTAALPAVKVKDCDVERSAVIELSTVGASTNEWRFTSRVTSGTFQAQSYEWDFGDGARLATTDIEVVHSYRFRPQDKRYSNFLVTLTMRSASGELLHTTHALGLPNPAFGRLQRHGEVAVFAERLVTATGSDDDEPREELTRLYHAYHAPVRIDRVVLKIRQQDGLREDVIGDYAPQESIGLRHILPSEPAEVKLALANMNVPSTRPLLLVFELTGATTDGVPASGVFSTQLL